MLEGCVNSLFCLFKKDIFRYVKNIVYFIMQVCKGYYNKLVFNILTYIMTCWYFYKSDKITCISFLVTFL